MLSGRKKRSSKHKDMSLDRGKYGKYECTKIYINVFFCQVKFFHFFCSTLGMN